MALVLEVELVLPASSAICCIKSAARVSDERFEVEEVELEEVALVLDALEALKALVSAEKRAEACPAAELAEAPLVEEKGFVADEAHERKEELEICMATLRGPAVETPLTMQTADRALQTTTGDPSRRPTCGRRTVTPGFSIAGARTRQARRLTYFGASTLSIQGPRARASFL